MIELVKSGKKYWGKDEFDGGRGYWIVKADHRLSELEVIEYLAYEHNIDPNGKRARCPGDSFREEMIAYTYGKKAIAYIDFGWDI